MFDLRANRRCLEDFFTQLIEYTYHGKNEICRFLLTLLCMDKCSSPEKCQQWLPLKSEKNMCRANRKRNPNTEKTEE